MYLCVYVCIACVCLLVYVYTCELESKKALGLGLQTVVGPLRWAGNGALVFCPCPLSHLSVKLCFLSAQDLFHSPFWKNLVNTGHICNITHKICQMGTWGVFCKPCYTLFRFNFSLPHLTVQPRLASHFPFTIYPGLASDFSSSCLGSQELIIQIRATFLT